MAGRFGETRGRRTGRGNVVASPMGICVAEDCGGSCEGVDEVVAVGEVVGGDME